MDDKHLLKLIGKLTLQEKAMLCSGMDFWQTEPLVMRGVPTLRMADGPHGVRVEDRKNRKQNGGHSKKATCFPPAVTLACSWDTTLLRDVGDAIAKECIGYNVGLLLGPGVNIKRSPLGGRNFEYYSEDPLLSGEMGAAFIQGVQQNGVGTSLKHFAVNSQETYRMSINAAIDDRALFDIYLKPFEIAIKKSQPDTVMASYNRINGSYATENRRLLNDILRLRFGFTGAVVTDWGAVYSRPAGIAAGCDLEMPASGGVGDWAVEKAVESGFLSEDALDTACFNLLRLVFRRSRSATPQDTTRLAAVLGESEETLTPALAQGTTAAKASASPAAKQPDHAAHHRLAAEALCKSTVLLKNDGMLPLADRGRIAIIGEMAQKPRYQGGGSSVVNPTRLSGFLSAMNAAVKSFVYAPGYSGTKTTPGMLAAATAAAKNAAQVLLFLGLPDVYECEGYDRDTLSLPQNQLQLLKAVAAANPNLCVVLCCGAPVETPWLGEVRALLCPHLGGQAQGEALVRLLYGEANPSGKLAESWPLALSDTPCAAHFPMGPNEVRYNESIFVGYRYYATAEKPVQFPFGHGLSYTRFSYSGLRLAAKKLEEGQPLEVHFTIKNTGDVAGDEIAQLYYAHASSACFQPAKQLCAFARVALAPGEAKEISLRIPYGQFSFHDTASGKAVVEQGDYTLMVGPSSEELPLRAHFACDGVQLRPEAIHSAAGPYGQIRSNRFATSDFSKLYAKPLDPNHPPKRGEYTDLTPLGLMEGAAARSVYALAHLIGRITIHFSPDDAANRKAARQTTHDLPFKNIVYNTSGIVSPAAADTLLGVFNKRGGLLRFFGQLLARKPYHKR